MKSKWSNKILVVVAVAILVTLLLSGCKSASVTTTAAAETTAAAQASDKVVIGIAMPEFVSPYYAVYMEGMKKAFAELPGWSYIVSDAEMQLSTQINQVEDFYAKGVDGLVIVSIDAKGIVPVIDKVYAKSDKKFVMVTGNVMTDPPQLDSLRAYAGPNAYYEAQVVATQFVDYLKQKGIEKISGVMITGLPGFSDTNDRKKGFIETIEKLGYKDKVTFLDIQPGNWLLDEGQKVMENFITAYGDKIEFVYAQDGTMLQGAWNALSAAGTKPGDKVLMGIGLQKENIKMIMDGIQQFDVTQLPSEDAKSVVDTLSKIFNGEKIEFFNYMTHTPVNKDNAEKFLPGEW